VFAAIGINAKTSEPTDNASIDIHQQYKKLKKKLKPGKEIGIIKTAQ